MEEKLLEILNMVLANNNLRKIDVLEDDTDLRRDLGMDSFNLAELTVHVEEAFDVDIFADGIVNTVGEIKTKLNAAA